MSWIKEAEFRAKCFSDLAWVGRDLRRLRRHGYEHLHKEVACWNIGGIERTNEANLVLRVCGMKAELLMKLADSRLLWCFVTL
jgi:hypothetical protein